VLIKQIKNRNSFEAKEVKEVLHRTITHPIDQGTYDVKFLLEQVFLIVKKSNYETLEIMEPLNGVFKVVYNRAIREELLRFCEDVLKVSSVRMN